MGIYELGDEAGKLLARLNKEEDISKVISSIKERDSLMKTCTHRNKSSIWNVKKPHQLKSVDSFSLTSSMSV